MSSRQKHEKSAGLAALIRAFFHVFNAEITPSSPYLISGKLITGVTKLKKILSSKWAWFIGLYLVSIIGLGAFMFSIRLILGLH